MRYKENGIEIQYRECQILRDTAKLVMPVEEDATTQSLIIRKREWLKAIENLLLDKQKKKYCVPLVSILPCMEERYFRAVAEYVISLLEKGKGIDIMVPYVTADKLLILPVNLHESSAEDGEID